jgi:hypothetical protein
MALTLWLLGCFPTNRMAKEEREGNGQINDGKKMAKSANNQNAGFGSAKMPALAQQKCRLWPAKNASFGSVSKKCRL